MEEVIKDSFVYQEGRVLFGKPIFSSILR